MDVIVRCIIARCVDTAICLTQESDLNTCTWYVMDDIRLIAEFPSYTINKRNGEIRNKRTDKVKTVRIDKSGYPTVQLSKNKKSYSRRPHCLMAETFICHIEECMIVHHKDDNKQNYAIENLEVTSSSQNTIYAYQSGRIKPKCHKVCRIDVDGKVLEKYPSITVASEKTGICSTSIRAACTGETRKAAGVFFCFEEDVGKGIRETKYPKKSVQCLDKATGKKVLGTYASIKEASDATGARGSDISVICKGKTDRKIANNFRWRYTPEKDKPSPKSDPRQKLKKVVPDYKKWKKIRGYSNYYISPDARIWSTYKGGCYRAAKFSGGYMRISLSKDGISRSHLLHRLVAIAYLKKVNGKEKVNHKDGNPRNNHLSNLEWIDNSGNMKHAYITGLNTKTQKAVAWFDMATGEERIFRFASLIVAAHFTGIDRNAISECARGLRPHGGGYLWAFVKDLNIVM